MRIEAELLSDREHVLGVNTAPLKKLTSKTFRFDIFFFFFFFFLTTTDCVFCLSLPLASIYFLLNVRGPLYTVLLTIFFSFAIELRTVRHRQRFLLLLLLGCSRGTFFFGTGPDIIISVLFCFVFFLKEKENTNSCLAIALRRFHPTPNRTPPSILLLFTIAEL